ncbi:glutathione peroxidase [Xylanimonas cellulosilytica DSM 15894]|uniref:Glutathione peroxidase n=1 Tax=Xylanimonas cellulosilytica (strain DSM 15894 / JCM 12276 / CECT 5975 / KCTC 9989 / LMG 20990 / NBRC 107835 / XIL07) TaxID=446471 RepID=D1BWX8_XYLCX|nr:glutathione peroxidase [Xylanimonas cellulosilytica]ACZ29710.1 glutathione peroxidase [Xylanimonas cellulosilytica DSM 15894]
MGKEIYDIPFRRMDGTTTTLAQLAGDDRVVLVVNVASRCGLTPQYEQLETLQEKYGDRGLTVVGFPSNQFLQELGSNEAIAEFCSTTYGVTFPVMDRIRVNGHRTAPLYEALKKTADAGGHDGRIRWNFEKFLVLPGGTVHRYDPRTLPDAPEIIDEIESHLPA